MQVAAADGQHLMASLQVNAGSLVVAADDMADGAKIGLITNSTVLINTSTASIRSTATRTSGQVSCDQAGEPKALGGDRVWVMTLHRPPPRAGGSLRVRQVL